MEDVFVQLSAFTKHNATQRNALVLCHISNMDIHLLLNSAESDACVSASSGRSPKDQSIPSQLPHSAEPRQCFVTSTLLPRVSYQTLNLQHGPCTIHPISPPQRSVFSPEDDALMRFMIDNIQSGRVEILGLCLKRGPNAIRTRWDVLSDYKPCSTCTQCERFRKRIKQLRRNYQGTDWTIRRYFLNAKIYVAIPPPRFIEQGATLPLPIVVRSSGQDSSLSPYITMNNDCLQEPSVTAKDGNLTSFVFSCGQFFQSGRLRLCFRSLPESYNIEFDISCR